jgi:NAD(P)-dependent dehydrogenase (short-subunit alcohol dehydrogenase family)
VLGKVVLVTGANSGLGLVTARELARQGARVMMLCRDRARGAQALVEVAKVATGPAPELLLADLSSKASVRAVAKQVRARTASLDVLVNNAGAIFQTRRLSVDGVEMTFATNHLGPFLLTNLLLDRLSASGGGRIVNVAAHMPSSRFDFDNVQGERRYGFLSAYFSSKLANLIFTCDLARRLQDRDVTVNAVSPGPTSTNFAHDVTGPLAFFIQVMKRVAFPPPETAAQTIVYLASSPEVAGVTGQFFFRGHAVAMKPVARDPQVGARLWTLCAGLVDLMEGVRV